MYKHIHADSLPNINHLSAPSTALALAQNPLSRKGKRLNTSWNSQQEHTPKNTWSHLNTHFKVKAYALFNLQKGTMAIHEILSIILNTKVSNEWALKKKTKKRFYKECWSTPLTPNPWNYYLETTDRDVQCPLQHSAMPLLTFIITENARIKQLRKGQGALWFVQLTHIVSSGPTWSIVLKNEVTQAVKPNVLVSRK